jgi:hypothetical protein
VGVVVVLVPPLAIGSVPVTPVDKGSPVALVSVADVGVPRTGVTKVGDVERTTEPEPVLVVAPVPPDATGKVPDVIAEVLVAYKAPPDVKDVKPVPPFVVASVPASVIAPDVADEGVKPVVPALKEVTPTEDTLVHVGNPAETVRICPVEPIGSMAVVLAPDW